MISSPLCAPSAPPIVLQDTVISAPAARAYRTAATGMALIVLRGLAPAKSTRALIAHMMVSYFACSHTRIARLGEDALRFQ